MNIAIKTNMNKLPEHCGECQLWLDDSDGIGKYCTDGSGDAVFVSNNVSGNTLNPDCPIVRDVQSKGIVKTGKHDPWEDY